MEIRGKVALITGGGARVGRAITLMLAQQGAHVVINYHTSAKSAEETAEAVNLLGVEAFPFQCDVSDYSAVEQMAGAIAARFGGVDIIVNAASHFGKISIPTDDVEEWRRVTRISIDGAFFVVNSLVATMLERGGGAIVNIVDLSAWQPWPRFTAHAVGKAGLLALTRQLALELAPTIRVNAVAPGPVLPSPGSPESHQAAAARRTLLGRWGRPEDVSGAVRYLLEADYMTGEVIKVDGGEFIAFHR